MTAPCSVPFNFDASLRPVAIVLDGPVMGDVVLVEVPVTDLLFTDEIVQASFTAKLAVTDADNAPTSVQVIYTVGEPAGGLDPSCNPVDPSSTQYLLTFPLTTAQVALLATQHGYDVRLWVLRAGSVIVRTVQNGTILAQLAA